ncbi:hypothetical protein D3C74_394250 [compost metagenome]
MGKMQPRRLAHNMPNRGFFGIMLAISCSDTNICRRAEKKTPIRIKGKASRKILINIVLKVSKSVENGIDKAVIIQITP